MAGSESGVNDATSPVEIYGDHPGLTDSKLFHEYMTRLTSDRDMHIMITAASETGVGKTTLAYVLATLMDQHGWTAEKATLDPMEYSIKYDEVPPGSVLVLDEAEQAADSRRGMKEEVRQLGHDFAQKRYKQVFGILTLPTKSWLDSRVSDDSMDYWIQCLETDEGEPKGEARVYRQRSEEHYETNYSEKTEIISWPTADGHDQFEALEAIKREANDGQIERKYVHRDEVEEIKDNYWQKATEKKENELIEEMYRYGLSQSDIANIVGVTQPTISRRLPDELT